MNDLRHALKTACFEAEKVWYVTKDRKDKRRVMRLRRMIQELK